MNIFRSYDVRGVYGRDIDEETMEKIGRSFAAHTKKDMVVARDCRISSPSLMTSFIDGAVSQGGNVIDAGMLPLGAGMFHAWQRGLEYAYITGSHLTKEWNGVKFFHSNGIGFLEKENNEIREIFSRGSSSNTMGSVKKADADISGSYVKYVAGKSAPKKTLSVVIDNGNGVSSIVAKKLFAAAGHNVALIFEDPDGTFPNRLPDPLDDEIGKLKETAANYDAGIAYDGDADRLALVDETGVMLSPEQTSYLILSRLLKTESGPIIANMECTRLIDDIARNFSRDVIRAPVGHTFLMQYVHDNRACFGVERSGHYCIPSILPFDDSMAISLYAIAALSDSEAPLSEIVKSMPVHVFRRTSYACPDDIKFEALKSMKKKIMEMFDNVNTLDGVRVDLENGWALLRVSNTSPFIRLTVEGDTKKDFNELHKEFIEIVKHEYDSRGLQMVEEHGKK